MTPLGSRRRGEIPVFWPPPMSRPLFTTLTARPWGRAFWRQYYRSLYPSPVPADFDEYLARQSAMLAEPGRFDALRAYMTGSKAASESCLGQVKAPTLVVMGSRDPDFPKPAVEARWAAEHIRGEILMADGAGHYPHTEFLEVVGPKIVAFLDSIRG